MRDEHRHRTERARGTAGLLMMPAPLPASRVAAGRRLGGRRLRRRLAVLASATGLRVLARALARPLTPAGSPLASVCAGGNRLPAMNRR